MNQSVGLIIIVLKEAGLCIVRVFFSIVSFGVHGKLETSKCTRRQEAYSLNCQATLDKLPGAFLYYSAEKVARFKIISDG